MAITTIAKTAFKEYFEASILDYLNGLTTQNYLSQAFNSNYKAIRSGEITYYKDLLTTKKGLIVLERSNLEMEEKMNDYFESEQTSTTRTFYTGYTYYTDLKLRLICKQNEVGGRQDLINMQSFMRKILNDTTQIYVKDYSLVTPINTSIRILFQNSDIEYTEIPVNYKDYAEGVYTIPISCDVYESETYNRVLYHKETFTNKKALFGT